ncbi:VOC family protein [Acidovorax sp. Root219]|uniref:VOC family protein n=1 Tax=Acidovorax sp. Root219 TaxID=1736493 RepID=UPI00070BBC08|nr:VOC family protein [Acidovorax sp. Root219]KRC35986.1 riboflavin deaminase [Acidovorax sp. Root219]
MLQLDHLSIIAPSLKQGVAHVRDCLGIDMPFGRQHPDMGTHNHLLRLGDDVYLEVIAIDPAAPAPAQARWFGLDDRDAVRAAWDSGRRLRGWVARTQQMDAVLAQHGHLLGRKTQLSAGAAPPYFFAIPAGGALPLAGVAPSVIDRGQRPPPIASMPDLGARLVRFTIEHPEPDMVLALYASLGIENAPHVEKSDRLHYRAEIRTPAGIKALY